MNRFLDTSEILMAPLDFLKDPYINKLGKSIVESNESAIWISLLIL